MLNNFQDIQTILAGPQFQDREFIRSGATFGEVYAMAAGFRAAFFGPEYEGASLCLAVDDRAVMAAALLAALAGGPTLLRRPIGTLVSWEANRDAGKLGGQ